jgi:hypothetical protein
MSLKSLNMFALVLKLRKKFVDSKKKLLKGQKS